MKQIPVVGSLLLQVIALLLPVTSFAKTYTVKVTSYNPVAAQTDNSPCHGASGVDLCAEARKGARIIGLSRDLVGRIGRPFRYGDRVWMTSKVPQCNGEFYVLDTMAKRHTMRADLFFLDRKDNTSCTATIVKLP